MKEATILDLHNISKLMGEYEGLDMHEYVRATLLSPVHFWYYNDKLNHSILFEVRDNRRAEIHTYGKGSGKKLMKWTVRCSLEVLRTKEIDTLINWVRKDQRTLRLFMASIRAHKVAEIGQEILYVHTKEDERRMNRWL